ncbi:MAG: carbohydrate ABC transporter permease [Pseudomonadota bacterium]
MDTTLIETSGTGPSAGPSQAGPHPLDESTAARRRRGGKFWAPYIFIAPFFVLFLVFGVFPLGFSVWLSLHQWDPAAGLEAMRWVGIENYTFALTDPWFHRSLYNTLWFAIVAGVPQHLVALPLAYFIHRRLKRSRNLVVAAYFVPYITSSVAIALIFSTLFSRDYGVINAVLGTGIDWLGDSAFTKPSVAFVVFWRFIGWNLVLYLSALQVIDQELYEAATLDGAGSWQQFVYITLPLLRPMIFFAVTLTIIGNLQLFEEPFILVDGEKGVSHSVMTSAIFMYRLAFSEGDFGTASAVSWLLFVVIAGLTWGNSLLFRKFGGEHGGR